MASLLITKKILEILAINTYYDVKQAFSINPRGSYEKLDFEFSKNTEVWNSCSLQWHNHYYVFGGESHTLQVSLVNGNRLERKATLGFNFVEGACTVLSQNIIVLCFGRYEENVCRKSNHPLGSFTRLPNSYYKHKHTRIASFDGKNTIY